MTVDFWLLLVSLLLLWFPRRWLRLGRKLNPRSSRHKSPDTNLRDSSDVSLWFQEEFKNPRNWVDFFRATAGAIGVCKVCFAIAANEPKETVNLVLAIQASLLVIAVCIQMIRYRQRLTVVAPVFFLMGLSFGLIDWDVAIFACVTIWALNRLIPTAGLFLMGFAGLELVFTLVLARGGSLKVVALAVALTAGPVLFSAMTKRRLVNLNRRQRSKFATP